MTKIFQYNGYPYSIVSWWSTEDSAYLAEIPEFGGCIQDGDTPEQAIARCKALAAEWVGIAQERGWAIPLPASTPPEQTHKEKNT